MECFLKDPGNPGFCSSDCETCSEPLTLFVNYILSCFDKIYSAECRGLLSAGTVPVFSVFLLAATMKDKVEYSDSALNELKNFGEGNVFTAIKTTWYTVFLLCSTVLFLCAVIWSVYGRITVSITGRGITLLSGGVSVATAPASGVITGINVDQGAKVLADQIIGQIYSADSDYQFSTKMSRLQGELGKLKLKRQEQSISSLQAKLLDEDMRILNDEIESLRRMSIDSTYVRAKSTGTVIELLKDRGAYVRQGDKIALVASDLKKGIYLVAYIPAKNGKRIKNGMRAFFSPSVAPAERYGYVRAVVRDVSDAPINRETILRELLNGTLTDMLAGDEAMIRVVIELMPDEHTPSGYSWTGSSSYEHRLTNGIYGTVIINVEDRSPVSYIVPGIRKLLEGSTDESDE